MTMHTFVTIVLTDTKQRRHPISTGDVLGKRHFMAGLYKNQDNGGFDLFVDTWLTDLNEKVSEKKIFSVKDVTFHSAVSKAHNYKDDWNMYAGEWKAEK